jgi:hypothetical protein
MGGPRAPSRWAAPVLAVALVASGALFLSHFLAVAPPLASLAREAVTLTNPVERVNPGPRGGRGPYARFAWQGGRAKVEHLCFFSDCALPPALASLRAGDRVTLWRKGDRVWQVEREGRLLLAYDTMRVAFDAAMKRKSMVELPLWLTMVALTVAVLLWRRRANAPVGRGRRFDAPGFR